MTEQQSAIFICDTGVVDRQKLMLDGFEATFLSVARHIFETFEEPSSQCWMMAFWYITN